MYAMLMSFIFALPNICLKMYLHRLERNSTFKVHLMSFIFPFYANHIILLELFSLETNKMNITQNINLICHIFQQYKQHETTCLEIKNIMLWLAIYVINHSVLANRFFLSCLRSTCTKYFGEVQQTDVVHTFLYEGALNC